MRKLLFLDSLKIGEDVALLLLRLYVGAFLIWGVWDNITSQERMAEFAAFLEANRFMYPKLLAPISVWVQFACGIGFLTGTLTRWSGILCAINFVVALVVVDAQGGIRQAFPATILVLIGLHLATRGAGRYSVDSRSRKRL
jgi:putative oxidoreductase